MPKSVRNFWIDADIDGRATMLSGGPTANHAGFLERIFIRDEGEVLHALTIEGVRFGDELRLSVADPEGKIVYSVTTKRDKEED